MAKLQESLQKLDLFEQEVTEGARARNIGNTDALRDLKSQIAASRTRLIETIAAMEKETPESVANAFKGTAAMRAS